MAKVLFQFSYVSGISTSDASVEKWVAKHLIKTNQIDRFESVTEYTSERIRRMQLNGEDV